MIKVRTFSTILILPSLLCQIQVKKHVKSPKYELNRVLIKGRKEEI
jgi:hypothetical protein